MKTVHEVISDLTRTLYVCVWGCNSTRLTCYGQRIGVICATIGKRVVEEKPFKKPKQRESDQKST